MENVENESIGVGNESGVEDASQVHIVSQKDIHDFWDHVSTGDRIGDVCTTFESESKQVIKKLYEQTATMGEKFAVANFLLQIGALQFRVQKNPEDENELQTIIILQKPDIAQNKTDETSAAVPESVTDPDAGDADGSSTEDGDKEGLTPREEEKEESFVPRPPEEHKCKTCHAILTSPWELDLHVLNECSDEPPGKARRKEKKKISEITAASQEQADGDFKPPGEKRKRGRPQKSTTDMPCTPPQEIQGGEKRRRGRPRKTDPSEEVIGSAKRKRGRPVKGDMSKGQQESVTGERDLHSEVEAIKQILLKTSPLKEGKLSKAELPKVQSPLLQMHQPQETRSKRKRRLPMKLREALGEEDLSVKEEMPVIESEKDEHKVADNDQSAPEEIEHGQETTECKQANNLKEEDLIESNCTGQDDLDDQFGGEDDKDALAADDDDLKVESDLDSSDLEGTNDDVTGDLNKDYITSEQNNGESDKPFKCSTCQKAFKTKSLFRQHLIMHRNKATNTTFSCVECNQVFYEKNELKRHMHGHKGSFPCDFCGKVFSHISHLSRHRNNVHTKEISFPCTLCDKVFYLKNRLKDHMVTHSGEKKFSCDVCGMKFFLLSALKAHKKSVHVTGKPFLCAECGTSFKSKSILKQHHLTVHTDIKRFPCRQCGKLFSRSSLRNQHEKVHEGVNPYPCEHCGKGFRDKFKLQVHVNWHLGIHPFQCSFCNKTFLVKGNLTKHMRIHTGERPYVCEQCGRGCVDSSQLKKHMAQAHKIQMDRVLTKGPARTEELPSSQRRRKKKTNQQLVTYPESESAVNQETQAYTIATDALIEISQQLADMSNAVVHVPASNSNLAIEPQNNGAQTLVPQQAAVNTVSSNVADGAGTDPEAGGDSTVFPVMIHVSDQDNEVTVPVTQSISDFQSLELITL